jgi:hypothetical protein
VKIPNAEQAYIDDSKLRDYSLNPEHPRGRHKARVFAAALGLTQSDVDLLRAALLRAITMGNKGNLMNMGSVTSLTLS